MDFATALASSVRAAVCSYLSLTNSAWGAVDRLVAAPFSLPVEWAQSITRNGLRLLCNREMPVPPAPPFTGGQCAGINYDWRTFSVIRRTDTNAVITTPQGVWRTGTQKLPGAIVSGGVRLGSDLKSWQEFATNSAGITKIGGGGTSASTLTIESQSFEVRRSDLAADTCGDPPRPTVTQPNSTTNINVTYNNNEGIDVTVPVVLVFAPVYINVKGELNIPFVVSVYPEVNIPLNGEVNVNTGDINIDFGSSGYGGGNSPKPPDYATDPSDDEDIPPDCPPPPTLPPSHPSTPTPTNRVIRGCVVTVTDVPDNITQIFQDENPDVFIPRLGNVSFVVQTGNTLSWTAEIPVKNRRQFIPCPWDGGAIRVDSTPQPGVTFSIAPVFGLVDAPVQYLL